VAFVVNFTTKITEVFAQSSQRLFQGKFYSVLPIRILLLRQPLMDME
jgi:hypothetical protein